MLMQDIRECIELLSVDGSNTKAQVKERLTSIYHYVINLMGTGKLKEDTYEEDWEVIAKRLEAEAEERLAMRQYEEEYNENPRRD